MKLEGQFTTRYGKEELGGRRTLHIQIKGHPTLERPYGFSLSIPVDGKTWAEIQELYEAYKEQNELGDSWNPYSSQKDYAPCEVEISLTFSAPNGKKFEFKDLG